MARQDRKRLLKNYKNVNREMARESQKFTNFMQEIPRHEWPKCVQNFDGELKPVAFWRSKKFLAQIIEEPNGIIRISVNRTILNEDYDYVDGITWDDLFSIKNQIGFADKDCIEIYPAAQDLVNIANIRHLFVLDKPHPFNWTANERKKGEI